MLLMKVHLIKKKSIDGFCENNAPSRNAFKSWLSNIKYADWSMPNDIVYTFGSVDLLGNGSNRVVFDIGGNKYRMICKYSFGKTKVHLYVKWIGTHASYTAICNNNEQYTINLF